MASSERKAFKSEKPHKCKSFRSIQNICLPPLRPLRKADLKPDMENYRHGCTRNSMFCNHLILKPELGRTRRICNMLPGSDFVYGMQNSYGDSVAETIGQWRTRPDAPPLKKIPCNFLNLNAKAVQAGLVTPAEYHSFRLSYEQTQAIKKAIQAGLACLADYQAFRLGYGQTEPIKKNKPLLEDMPKKLHSDQNVTITDLIQQKFKNQWIQKRIMKDAIHYNGVKLRPREGYYQTCGAKIRQYRPQIKPSPPWQLAQFQKAEACLNTFSDEKIHQKSLKNFREEAPMRCGALSLGNYTSAF
ncbi:cilia- and flagella-associated protein 77-like [Trichosurus vulpecula]|uniref:cilia- and flagella-associated protein 77-like n=1 Tax=Trichosurus vulpecula TaxID=9337 RepID=UPI00186AEB6D|nr:cilia- and flagella-associated protein 77-like [Trichosurus vulpecula]